MTSAVSKSQKNPRRKQIAVASSWIYLKILFPFSGVFKDSVDILAAKIRVAILI